jgi:hypothetical protein
MVDYRFDEAQRLLTVTLSGVIRADDFHTTMPDVPEGSIELLDMSEAVSTEVTGPEIRKLAERDLTGPDRITRMAIVATTELGFGLARMYQTLSDSMGTEVRVFRDRGEARRWLGLDQASES